MSHDRDIAAPILTTASAVDAAVAVAREHGLALERPRVLAETNNVMVELHPAPVVARVVKTLAPIRPNRGGDHLRREVELATFVHAHGGPVVPPSGELPPGPHLRDGHWLTFWQRADGESRASSEEAAPILRELHELIAGYEGSLPVMSGVVEEVPAMLAAAVAGGGMDEPSAALVARRLEPLAPRLLDPGLPLRPLHGDPHVGNLLTLGGRPVWNDWEDACLGPVQWDLVCLLRACGAVPRAEVAPYGSDIDPKSLEPFVEARTIQGASWLALLSRDDPSRHRQRDEMLAWLADRETGTEAS